MAALKLAVLLVLLVSCLAQSQGRRNKEGRRGPGDFDRFGGPDGEEEGAKVKTFSQLELDVQKKLLQSEDDSVVFSPLSIRALLAIVREGSAGQTRSKLDSSLGDTNNMKWILRDKQEGFTSGSAVFYSNRYDINQKFVHDIADNYQAEMQYTDFSKPDKAAFNMNEWVRRVTKKGIKEIMSAEKLSGESIFIAVNAIRLDATWRKKFDPDETFDGVFYEKHGDQLVPQYVKMMRQNEAFRQGHIDSLKARVIELPFEKPGRFSFYLVTPNDPNGLTQLVNDLKPESLGEIIKSVRNPDTVNLYMPRFKINTAKSIRNLLPPDLATIFDSTANFKGISSQAFQLTEMRHKAELSLNEQGVQGTGSTDLEAIALSSIPPPTYNITHPFLFLITEQPPDHRYGGYGNIHNPEVLFMGTVTKLDEAKPLPSNWGPLAGAPTYVKRQFGSLRRQNNG